MRKFVTIAIALFASRFFDIYTTYKYIPDLKGEINPLVSILKFEWTGAITVQAVVLCLLLYPLYIYCFKTVETAHFDSHITLKEFISYFHFNRPDHFSKLLYKLPSNTNSSLYFIGAVVPKGLIFFSFIVGTSTSLLIYSQAYRDVYRQFRIPIFLYALSAIIMVFLSVSFYRREREARLKTSHIT